MNEVGEKNIYRNLVTIVRAKMKAAGHKKLPLQISSDMYLTKQCGLSVDEVLQLVGDIKEVFTDQFDLAILNSYIESTKKNNFSILTISDLYNMIKEGDYEKTAASP